MNDMEMIRVLHVDDEPGFADMTASFLERENDRITVDTATNVDEGLDKLEENCVDCIISDYDMPGRNGIELLGAVREEYPDIPFILFTGKGSEEVAADAIRAGATDYLQKQDGTEQYNVLANRLTNYADKYRAEQKTAQQSQAMKTVKEGIAIVDEDGQYVEVNEAYADSYGAAPEEMTGQHWTLTVPADEAERLQEEVFPQLGEAKDWTGETIGQRADGSTYPKLVTLSLLNDGGHVCAARDLTEIKEREQSLRRLEEEFETVFNNAKDALFLFDVVETDAEKEFKLRRMNPAHEAMTGLSSEELRGATPHEIVGEEQGYEVTANLRECVEAEEPISYEEVLEMPTGSFDWQTKLAPVIKDGEVTQIVGVARNITEQKEREQRYNAIFNQTYQFTGLLEPDGTLIEANETALQFCGLERDDVIGKKMWEAEWFQNSKETEKRARSAVNRAAEGEFVRHELTVQGADREAIIDFSVRPVTNEQGEVSLLIPEGRDITERKEREQELRRLKERFQAFTEQSSDIITVVDETGTIQYESPAVEDILGYTPEGLEGEEAFDYLHPDDHDPVREQFNEMVGQPDIVTSRVEYRFKHADGSWVWLESIGSNQKDTSIDGYVITSRDVTNRKERERVLEDRKEILRSAYETIAANDRTVSKKIDGLLELYRNYLGTDYATFSHIDDDQYEYEAVAVSPEKQLEAGKTTTLDELPICKKVYETREPLVLHDVSAEAPDLADPTWGIRSYIGAPVVVNDEPYGTFSFYDDEPHAERFTDWETTVVELLSDWVSLALTKQQAREQLQRQNERLDEFAGVVSHDLRNPLTVAEGNLELAIADCDSEHLNEVEQAHDRMATLIEDLLTLAREDRQINEYEAVDLNGLVEECWLNVETGDANLRLDVDRSIQGDRSRLGQLLENLMRNAIDHAGDDVTISIGQLDDGFYVEDNGPGIPLEEREDVFSAGYSTSEQGTGFGLDIVQRVAEAHGWTVTVDEGREGGARFVISNVTFVGSPIQSSQAEERCSGD